MGSYEMTEKDEPIARWWTEVNGNWLWNGAVEGVPWYDLNAALKDGARQIYEAAVKNQQKVTR
jgi:hypothetical protein